MSMNEWNPAEDSGSLADEDNYSEEALPEAGDDLLFNGGGPVTTGEAALAAIALRQVLVRPGFTAAIGDADDPVQLLADKAIVDRSSAEPMYLQGNFGAVAVKQTGQGTLVLSTGGGQEIELLEAEGKANVVIKAGSAVGPIDCNGANITVESGVTTGGAWSVAGGGIITTATDVPAGTRVGKGTIRTTGEAGVDGAILCGGAIDHRGTGALDGIINDTPGVQGLILGNGTGIGELTNYTQRSGATDDVAATGGRWTIAAASYTPVPDYRVPA